MVYTESVHPVYMEFLESLQGPNHGIAAPRVFWHDLKEIPFQRKMLIINDLYIRIGAVTDVISLRRKLCTLVRRLRNKVPACSKSAAHRIFRH